MRPRTRFAQLVAHVLILTLLAGLVPAPAQASIPSVRRLLAPTASSLAESVAPAVLAVVATAQGHAGAVGFAVADPLLPGKYHRARWMDPRSGRFVSLDTWEGLRHEPATLHKYVYAHASPTLRTDPSGRFTTVELVTVGAIIGALTAIAIVQPRTTEQTVKAVLAGAAVGALLGYGAALYLAGALTGAATATGAGGAAGVGIQRLTEGIRATQTYLDPQKVEQFKTAMLQGQWRFQSLEGQIGGWKDAFGRYIIGEGHHRMAAALKIAMETGNTLYVQLLLQYGRWTPGAPAQHNPFPLP